MDTHAEKDCRRAVAKIMERHMGKASILDELAKIVIQMRGAQVAACHVRKHQIAVFPLVPDLSPLPLLLDLVLFEEGKIEFRQVYQAFAAFRFRLILDIPVRVNVINGPQNMKHTPLHINVAPAQCKNFSATSACDNGCEHDQLQPMSLETFDQLLCLLHREGCSFTRYYPGRVH